jgi:dephospho-CoA kinase
MLKVGLTGGLASGKTLVGEALESMGCLLIQADRLGHEALEPGGEAFEPVVGEFGPEVLDQGGRIDRRLLAGAVFDRPERLAVLNALVHPVVLRREEELMAVFNARQPHGMAVVEAAILIETGSFRRFDKLVLVACDEPEQIRRAIRRDGITEAEARARLASQMPLSEKRKYADFVIDTSGDKAETLRQTRQVYESLRRLNP